MSDAATRLTGARFGAFFSSPFGERSALNAYSGAARPAFEATPLLDPALVGSALLRVADAPADARFAQLARPPSPLALAIRSVLATRVTGRGRKLFGVLSLGHPDAGVFGEESEAILPGLAAYAAVAIDNARLYEAERGLRQEAERANRVKDEFLCATRCSRCATQ